MKKLFVIWSILLGLMAFIENNPDPSIQSDECSAYNVALKTLDAINNSDYESLSGYIHPEKGAVFTPFSYVDYDEDLVFFPAQRCVKVKRNGRI